MQTNDVDVIVVGLGSAGLAAAITAHDTGAKVLMLEKAPPEHAGGNSRVSGQLWFSPHDVDAARTHLRAMAGDYPVQDDVISALADESSANNEWVSKRIEQVRGSVARDDGDPLDPVGLTVNRVPFAGAPAYPGQLLPEHEYWDVPGNECGTERNLIGAGLGHGRLWNTLHANVVQRGIEIRYSTGAQGLTRDRDGRVVGVEARNEARSEVRNEARSEARGEADGGYSVGARNGVVIATGGFAANHEMTRNYLRLPDAVPWGAPYNTGDGIRMTQRLGADLDHPYNYMSITGIRLGERRLGEQAEVPQSRYVHVGADGRRFIDETAGSWHGKTRVRGTFDFHPGVPMWTVFDETARLSGPIVVPRQHFPVGWSKQMEGYRWSADNSAEIEKGWIVRAESISELGSKLGIDPAGLTAEIELYNEAARAGSGDRRFGRPAASMTPIERAPFYGYRWAQLLISTLGGLRKDGAGRVIDVDGTAIGGLYAAGEVASSFSWLVAGGLSLGDALAFGRIAGRNAALDNR